MKKKTISMSVKDFIKEHKRLINLLRNPNAEELAAEADRQEKEAEEYGLDLEDSDGNEEDTANMPLEDLKKKIQQ